MQFKSIYNSKMFSLYNIFIWTQFWRPEKLFRSYLSDIAETSNRNLNGEYQTRKGKDISYCISIIIFIFIFKMLQFISLTFSQHNRFYRFITYDIIFLFGDCPASMISFSILMGTELIYFFYRSYFFADNKKKAYPILLVNKIFYQDFNGYFLNNYKKIKNKNAIKWHHLLKKCVTIYQTLFQSLLLYFGNFC